MSLRVFPYDMTPTRPAQLALVVLKSEETIERDFRWLIPDDAELLTTRVHSGDDVTPETLAAMEGQLGGAAALLPTGARLGCIAYACTSGSAQIGPARVTNILRGATQSEHVTDPVTALVAACKALNIKRLALLSPYTADVSDRLRTVLATAGIETPIFGSFNVAEEARVVRIDGPSIIAAAETLLAAGGVDALFLSCTNLRTLTVIDPLEAKLGLPVLSSNLVLAWHMCALAGIGTHPDMPGRLKDAKPSLTQA